VNHLMCECESPILPVDNFVLTHFAIEIKMMCECESPISVSANHLFCWMRECELPTFRKRALLVR
jgi:hypothetical protein